MFSLRLASAFTALSTACAFAVAAPTTVAGNATSLVSLGSFAAGIYNITASGLINLGAPGWDFRPNGVPDVPFAHPSLTYINGGTTFFNTSFGPAYGAAGTSANVGSLIGTLNPADSPLVAGTAAPSATWFQIGFGTTVTLASAGTIYAAINDTYLYNNTGSFQVEVTPVPEPAQWVLALVGLAALGLKARRRAA